MPLASKIGTDALLTPLLAMILACLISGMIHPNLFSLVNAQVGLLIMLLALVSGGLTVMSFLYLRASKTSGRTLREMDDELNENRRAINEMEIKTMQAENENLHNLLDLKRKELVSVAMNLSEQKEFMDGLYEKVKQAQAEMEPEKKDELLHELRRHVMPGAVQHGSSVKEARLVLNRCVRQPYRVSLFQHYALAQCL